MESAYDDIQTINSMIPVMPVKFSKKSCDFLTTLISLSKHALINIHSLQYQEIESRLLRPNEHIQTHTNYDLIPLSIRKSRFMEFATKKHIHRVTVVIKQRTYNFMIMQFDNVSSSVLTQEAMHIIKQSCVWLIVASNFAPRECSNTVNINMYMTEHKKSLPEVSGEYIDMEHINTAFTTSCAKTTTINLFRKEEWFKVFIHETFHNLGMDFSKNMDLTNKANGEILRIFQINSEMRIFETYCEVWAEILNILIRNTSKHMRMLSNNIIKLIEYDLQMERAFSLFQTVKLLRYFGIKYRDFLQVQNSGVRGKYKEHTEAFCYFVLRSIILFDVNRFVEWCITHNRNVIRFDIGETANQDSNIVKYVRDLILSQHNHRDFLRAIEIVEETLFLPKKRIKKVNLMYKTMRMTVFG